MAFGSTEGDSPPPLPMSIPNPNLVLDEGSTSKRTRTRTKSCRVSANDSLLPKVCAISAIIVGAILTKKFLSWFQLMRHPVLRSKGSKENEKERRDEVLVWAELPLEVWREIGKRLICRADILCFRSVCKRCRLSLPYPTRFPLLVPRPPGDDRRLAIYDNVPYFITEASKYSVDIGSEANPDSRWVLMEFEELDQSGKFRAVACLPEEAKCSLPMVSSTPPDPEHQLSRLSFIDKGYQIRMAVPHFDSLKERVEGKWDFINTALKVRKIVLISCKLVGVDTRYDPASELSVVALLRPSSRLALLRLGGSQEPNWDWETSFCSGVFQDIVTYKGRLCTLDHYGRVFLMDYDSLQMTQIATPLCSDPSLEGWKQLVEVSGDLYLIVKSKENEAKVEVKVYKLSPRLRRWLEVDCIGNRVFLREMNSITCIPMDVLPHIYRSVLPHIYRSLMMKCGSGRCCYKNPPSLLFAHHHVNHDDDESDVGVMGYCFVGLAVQHYIPWPPAATASMTMTTTTSAILSQYDNSVVGRTNYRELQRSARGSR